MTNRDRCALRSARATFCAVLLLELASAGVFAPRLAAQKSTPLPAWGALTPGPARVGFSSWVERDSSRSTDGEVRAVQVSVWYPTTKPALAPRLHYADYVALGATERGQPASDSANSAAITEFVEFLVSNRVPRDDVMHWMASEMYAHVDTARAMRAGQPLVLVAQGNGQAAYSQAVLCELLASHGYVVLTTPSPVRLGAPLTSDADIYPLVSAQATDLEVGMRAAVRRGLGDSLHVATIGHSLGARASLLLVLRHHASLLVSLDGGIANAQGRSWLDSAHLSLGAARGSLVHLYQQGDSTVIPDFRLVRQLTGMDRSLILAAGLRHWNFTSFGTSAAAFPTVAPGPTTPANERTSADVMRVTRCVLDAWVRGRRSVNPAMCLDRTRGLTLRERLAATASGR